MWMAVQDGDHGGVPDGGENLVEDPRSGERGDRATAPGQQGLEQQIGAGPAHNVGSNALFGQSIGGGQGVGHDGAHCCDGCHGLVDVP